MAQVVQAAVEASNVKWTDVIGALSGFITCSVAVVGAAFAYKTYNSRTEELATRNILDRFSTFLDLEKILDKYDSVKAIEEAHSKADWSEVTLAQKLSFMAFYEQLALLVQSGLLSEDLAYYSYGRSLLLAYEDTEFWRDADHFKDDAFWSLFHAFYRRMFRYRKRYSGRGLPVETYRF